MTVSAAAACHVRPATEMLSEVSRRLPILVRSELARRGYRLGEAEQDEVVQDILIEVWLVDLQRYDPARGELLSFVRRRVGWRVADRVRALARAQSRAESLDARREHSDGEPIAHGDAPDELSDCGAQERALLQMEKSVRASLREAGDDAACVAVQRHDLEGVPLCVVAQELGVHPSGATRARQRGLRRLRTSLAVEAMQWRAAA